MTNAFSRPPTTRQEWQSRAQTLLRELERYSLDELLRGGSSKRGQTSDDQPRVPAGHPNGGQWTSGGSSGAGINDPRVLSDAIPDNEWIPGADYAARWGHHYAVRQSWDKLPLRPETRAVFEKAVSGPLPDKIWSRREQRWLRHVYDDAHREYNLAVSKLMHDYMRTHGIKPRRMTPDQAEDILQAIYKSSDPRIARYNYMINVMRRYYRRFGGRGNE